MTKRLREKSTQVSQQISFKNKVGYIRIKIFNVLGFTQKNKDYLTDSWKFCRQKQNNTAYIS